jgi:hypothetical protein
MAFCGQPLNGRIKGTHKELQQYAYDINPIITLKAQEFNWTEITEDDYSFVLILLK